MLGDSEKPVSTFLGWLRYSCIFFGIVPLILYFPGIVPVFSYFSVMDSLPLEFLTWP